MSEKTWYGLTNFTGQYIWTDGNNIYCDYVGSYVLNKSNSTWVTKTWYGLSQTLEAYNIWHDGDKTYCFNGGSSFVLDVADSTWRAVTFVNETSHTLSASYIWSDGEYTYYTRGTEQATFLNTSVREYSFDYDNNLLEGIAEVNDKVNDVTAELADLTFYLEQTVTLSTSATTTATFSNAKITANSLIDIAVSEWGLVPDNVTVSAGTCTVTMPQVDSAHSVTVRIYVR